MLVKDHLSHISSAAQMRIVHFSISPFDILRFHCCNNFMIIFVGRFLCLFADSCIRLCCTAITTFERKHIKWIYHFQWNKNCLNLNANWYLIARIGCKIEWIHAFQSASFGNFLYGVVFLDPVYLTSAICWLFVFFFLILYAKCQVEWFCMSANSMQRTNKQQNIALFHTRCKWLFNVPKHLVW